MDSRNDLLTQAVLLCLSEDEPRHIAVMLQMDPLISLDVLPTASGLRDVLRSLQVPPALVDEVSPDSWVQVASSSRAARGISDDVINVGVGHNRGLGALGGNSVQVLSPCASHNGGSSPGTGSCWDESDDDDPWSRCGSVDSAETRAAEIPAQAGDTLCGPAEATLVVALVVGDSPGAQRLARSLIDPGRGLRHVACVKWFPGLEALITYFEQGAHRQILKDLCDSAHKVLFVVYISVEWGVDPETGRDIVCGLRDSEWYSLGSDSYSESIWGRIHAKLDYRGRLDWCVFIFLVHSQSGVIEDQPSGRQHPPSVPVINDTLYVWCWECGVFLLLSAFRCFAVMRRLDSRLRAVVRACPLLPWLLARTSNCRMQS